MSLISIKGEQRANVTIHLEEASIIDKTIEIIEAHCKPLQTIIKIDENGIGYVNDFTCYHSGEEYLTAVGPVLPDVKAQYELREQLRKLKQSLPRG